MLGVRSLRRSISTALNAAMWAFPDGRSASMADVAKAAEQRRLVYFGEVHAVPDVVRAEIDLARAMADSAKRGGGKLTVLLEHFAFEQQSLLDSFAEANSNMTVEELSEKYAASGDEAHKVAAYSKLLELPRSEGDSVRLVAGFVPRRYAKAVAKGEEQATIEDLRSQGYLPKDSYMTGSDEHYALFESLISGGSVSREVAGRFKKIFPAQILKDSVMANIVTKAISASTNPHDKFLVICGRGHCEYRFGVPERVDKLGAVAKDQTLVVTVRDNAGPLEKVDWFAHSAPADLVFIYDDESTSAKSEISGAYNRVAETAHRPGNLQKAERVLTKLGYTPAQIAVAGADAYNYQGVGNPHLTADIRSGHAVLDLGSGLGVDTFIAAEAVGTSGSVVGVDLSTGEVDHAQRRAQARGVDGRVRFVQGDIERVPLPDESVDRVISNGAFCLAQNHRKAYGEVLRVLRPGGRFSIACSTLKKALDDEVEWPICMKSFIPLPEAEPMLKDLGFVNVKVEVSRKMVEEGEEEKEPEPDTNPNERVRVHVGAEEFKHLSAFNMNELCAIVIVTGEKPKDA